MKNNIRHFWYSKTFIMLEICKLARNRELAFLQNKEEAPPTRNINSPFMDMLNKQFTEFRFLDRDYNLYYSLAHLKDKWGIFSYNPIQRQKQQAEFVKKFHQFFTGYDLGIDFDGNKAFNKDLMYYNGQHVTIEKKHYGKEGIDSYDIDYNGKISQVLPEDLTELTKQEQIQRALTDMRTLKEDFDTYKINASYRFSGSKGFHVNVDDKNFPDVLPQTKVEICDKLTKEFSSILNLPTLDTSLCQDRRIWKMCYSLVGENVCLPLDDRQIENFELKDMNALTVLNKLKIKDRGLLERNNHFPLEFKKKCFVKLLKDYEVKYLDSKPKKELKQGTDDSFDRGYYTGIGVP